MGRVVSWTKRFEAFPRNYNCAGREYEKENLQSVLRGEPQVVAIQASTKNEAITFIIAAAKTFQDEEGGQFFSKIDSLWC